MFERFTPEVRSAIFIARQVAQATGGSEIAPEHLVIALLTVAPTCLSSDEAASVLAQLGRIDDLESPSAAHAQEFMPFSTNTKNSFAAAAERAAHLGHRWVRSEHVLASVLREMSTVAAQSLHSAGVSADTLEALALARPPADTEPISTGPTMRAIVSPFRRH